MTSEHSDSWTLLSGPLGPDVGGSRRPGESARPVENPADLEIIATVGDATADVADEAVAVARAAQPAWGRKTMAERSDVLRGVIAEVERHSEELAAIVVAEQGKTITEARGEIAGVRSFFDFAASRHRYRDLGEVIAPTADRRMLTVTEEPLGVVAAITPWNFPAAIFARKVAPALMAGNAIVLKPSEITPLSALALTELCHRAGVPVGIVNVVPGDGLTVGDRLAKHPGVDLVTMTGSTRAGKQVLQAASTSLTPVSLELGGKAPFIVFADADLDAAVDEAVTARFQNCGQVCTCNERTFVHASIAHVFEAKLRARVDALVVGDPRSEHSQMGPKVSAAELEKVDALVQSAIDAGARVATGGARLPSAGDGHWYAPTVLTDVRDDMDIMTREIFGPVLPVTTFDRYDEVIARANASAFGLTSYVFTTDFATAMNATRDLEFGEVYVNRTGPEEVQGFHTGWKESGMGGEDGEHGYRRYVRSRTTYLDFTRRVED
ncbi:aldehyde dehydrogenase family protein [Agrococcus sp. KRD186]|uniref:aldehyde dehydrogenase family protein n=1 Tax=Agrococcus sp. KRD186 TaxID=2729730 RepID=UPI0019CF7C52|nr:aldehyde dehydrogenase family protein [Agrococcus sp. KRD186]